MPLVAAAAISAGASLYGASQSARASKSAANTQAAAEEANRQDAAAQRDYARTILQPEVNRGNRAQSYLDALYYGSSGTPGGQAQPQAAPTAPNRPSLDSYIASNPGLQSYWESWETGRGSGRHRQVFGDFEGYARSEYEKAYGQAPPSDAEMTLAAEGEQPYVTRDDVLANIRANPLYQQGEEDFGYQIGLSDRQLGDTMGYVTGDYAARTGATNAFTDAELSRIAADEARRRAELEEARSQREGALTSYITAWDANARTARDRAEDQMFSRGGVTGQIGQTRRGVAQVGEDYARSRALEEATGRQSILDSYLNGRQGIGEWAYDTRSGAYGNQYADNQRAYDLYADGRQGASDRFYQQRYAAGQQRSNARTSAYDDYSGYLSDEQAAGRQARSGQASAGQAYVNAASNARSNAAGYRAAGQLAGADAWNTGVNNAAKAVGDYWAQRNRKSQNGYFDPSRYDVSMNNGVYTARPRV